MIDDLDVDPSQRKRLVDAFMPPPATGLGPALGRAIARPSPAPLNGQRFSDQPIPGMPSALDAPPPRNFDLAGGAKMTINDPTVGYNPNPGGQPTDAYGANVGAPNPIAPSPADDVYHHNYSSGSNQNNSGKNKFTRFKQALGHDPSDAEIRQFVAANPNEWEDSTSPTGEYVFRQKQGFLNDPNNLDSKTGANTIWQNHNFVNAAGSGDGYAPPYEEHQDDMPIGGGGTGSGPFGTLSPTLSGDPNAAIQALLAQQGQIPSILKLIQGMQ